MLPDTEYDNASPGNADRLRDALTFDAPCVRVGVDGYARHDAPDNVHAPDVWHDDADDVTGYDREEWELVTGYTGQHGYRGGVMHASEYIGGRLASDILNNPGIYAVCVVGVLPEWRAASASESADWHAGRVGSSDGYRETDDGVEVWDDDPEPAGWAVLRYVPDVPPVVWANAFGDWHAATATGATDDDADDARKLARAAIVRELRARAPFPEAVDTARMRVELAGSGRPQDGRVVWREVWDDETDCNTDADGYCDGSCVRFRHTWSASGARCTVCPTVGTGDTCGDGNCVGHPDHPDTTRPHARETVKPARRRRATASPDAGSIVPDAGSNPAGVHLHARTGPVDGPLTCDTVCGLPCDAPGITVLYRDRDDLSGLTCPTCAAPNPR